MKAKKKYYETKKVFDIHDLPAKPGSLLKNLIRDWDSYGNDSYIEMDMDTLDEQIEDRNNPEYESESDVKVKDLLILKDFFKDQGIKPTDRFVIRYWW